jgi:hypothetical protein
MTSVINNRWKNPPKIDKIADITILWGFHIKRLFTTAALNAMNSGSALASLSEGQPHGNTVTLTKGINAQRDITVPAGVTLTVNGTVNASSRKIGFDGGGGVIFGEGCLFTMNGGRIQGSTDSDSFTRNIRTGTVRGENGNISMKQYAHG